jgi:glycolate oxidase
MLEDVGVPRPQLARMVDDINAIAAELDLRCATFGHAGDGNLHPTIVFDPHDLDARARAEAAFDRIFRRALELGGTLTGEHGVGATKLPWLERRLGADQVALLRRVKAAFDPAGILNPGKLGS